MDTVYPQPIRLRLETTSRRKRGYQNRYRTQPVTFSEIKEVDEENTDEEPDTNRRMSAESPQVMTSKSSTNVNAKFEHLKRRPEKKISCKLQHRLDISRKPSISSIPGSPENGKENPINLLPKIPRSTDKDRNTSDSSL